MSTILRNYPRVDSLRGWRISEDWTAPVTGRWKATRFGVRIGAHSYDALCNMIRQREDEWTNRHEEKQA
jgi:hypothetical protein